MPEQIVFLVIYMKVTYVPAGKVHVHNSLLGLLVIILEV